MSKNQELVPAAFKAMTTDIQVSMDDVVSAFVSQYENNLYARKKDLSHDVRLLEQQLVDNVKDVRRRVTGAEFKKQRLPWGLRITVDDGTVDWEAGEISFNITIKKDSRQYGNSIAIRKGKKIPAANLRLYKTINDELEDLRADLSEVLVALKSVDRKERQVRGRIAIRKLEDSGYASLMQDSELIQLVQLDD